MNKITINIDKLHQVEIWLTEEKSLLMNTKTSTIISANKGEDKFIDINDEMYLKIYKNLLEMSDVSNEDKLSLRNTMTRLEDYLFQDDCRSLKEVFRICEHITLSLSKYDEYDDENDYLFTKEFIKRYSEQIDNYSDELVELKLLKSAFKISVEYIQGNYNKEKGKKEGKRN